jgi:hypothetical protein
METQDDFRELLAFFNAQKVKYVIVGAHALAFHGVPRYTGDFDIPVKPDHDNAQAILMALHEFRFASAGLTVEDFTLPEKIVQLGYPPVRIDLITSITGVRWEDVYTSAAGGTYGEVPVQYIGKNEFIANKKAIGRHKDLTDIEMFGER